MASICSRVPGRAAALRVSARRIGARAFGRSLEIDVVDETWFVTDLQDVMANLRTVFGVRDEVYGGEYDVTQTMIEVSGLVYPELLVEIKFVAVVDSASEWQRDVVATRTSDDAS